MPVIDWNDSMSIGIPLLDQDHRTLLGHFNELLQGIEQGWSREALSAASEALEESIRQHFRQEQEFLQRLTQPDGIVHRLEHIERHDEFLTRTAELNHELAEGRPRRPQVESLILSLTDFELVRFDFQMVGYLLREGLLGASTVKYLPA